MTPDKINDQKNEDLFLTARNVTKILPLFYDII